MYVFRFTEVFLKVTSVLYIFSFLQLGPEYLPYETLLLSIFLGKFRHQFSSDNTG